MWIDYRKTKNLITAEMWKNLLEGEGLPAKIIPEGNDILDWSEYVTRPRLNILDDPLMEVILLESCPPVQDSAKEILIFFLLNFLIIFLLFIFIYLTT